VADEALLSAPPSGPLRVLILQATTEAVLQSQQREKTLSKGKPERHLT